MNTETRLARIRQAEELVDTFVRKGWRLEAITVAAVDGEPMRVTVELTVEPESALGGIL